jgi:hypothetical protein
MTYCGTLGQWYFVLFSDLIVGKITEGSSRTDPRASDMVSPPKHRLFPSRKLLSTRVLIGLRSAARRSRIV